MKILIFLLLLCPVPALACTYVQPAIPEFLKELGIKPPKPTVISGESWCWHPEPRAIPPDPTPIAKLTKAKRIYYHSEAIFNRNPWVTVYTLKLIP